MACNDCTMHHIAYCPTGEKDEDGEEQYITVFPQEPSWWHDDTDEAEQQRQHIFHDFDQTELVMLLDDVWMYVETQPETADEVAQLTQRLLSLPWMTEVCLGSMNDVDEDDNTTYWVRYWMGRAAKYLGCAAWQCLVGIPAASVKHGVHAVAIGRHSGSG